MAYRPPYRPRVPPMPPPPRQFPPSRPILGQPPFLPPPPHQLGYGPPPPAPGGYGYPPPRFMAYPPPFPPMVHPPHPRLHPRHARPWKRPRNWADGGGRGQGRYFRAKRPHTYGARELGNFGYNDPYYDLSMFEDPWKELLEARGIVDGGMKHSGLKATEEEMEGEGEGEGEKKKKGEGEEGEGEKMKGEGEEGEGEKKMGEGERKKEGEGEQGEEEKKKGEGEEEGGMGAKDSISIDTQKTANGSAGDEDGQSLGSGDANHTAPTATCSNHESNTVSGDTSTVSTSESITEECSN